MKTLGNLKTSVKRYLTGNVTLVNVVQGDADATKALEAQIDMGITVAANNARKYAEMSHDFSANRMTGFATLSPGTALSLDSVAIDTTDTPATRSFKTLNAVYIRNSTEGTLVPVKVVARQTQMVGMFKRQDLETPSWDSTTYAVVNGRLVTLDPLAEATEIAIDGNVWMEDYVDDSDTDWMLEHGFEFMMWQCIIELNHMLQKFVPRQEGALAPPVRSRDEALDKMIVNDSYTLDIYHDL